jgi:hypothetical protein
MYVMSVEQKRLPASSTSCTPIAIDSQGRIFVGDRSNNRFQYVECQALVIDERDTVGLFFSLS